MPGLDQSAMNESVRKSDEYQEGRGAFTSGVAADGNPYPSNPLTSLQRVRWYVGWLDARTSLKLAQVFRKYKLSYP